MILLGLHVLVFEKSAVQLRLVSTPKRMGLAYKRMGEHSGTDGNDEKKMLCYNRDRMRFSPPSDDGPRTIASPLVGSNSRPSAPGAGPLGLEWPRCVQ